MDVCHERIENCSCVKLLDIKIDPTITFDNNETLRKKASLKINTLARISSYMTF